MATAQRVTLDQRQLARSMGLDHLLDLKCDTLPRGVVHYLASNFDVPSRAIELPNGFKFTITPYCIHQVLGIPLGSRTIEKKQNPALRSLIAQQTKCKGNYPTINELDNLIQPGLDGDSFKRIFTMYALTVLLCPSSHGAASPDYYHILEDPEQIGSFDFCMAVLDKLVASIDSYKAGATTVLGGDILTLRCVDTKHIMDTSFFLSLFHIHIRLFDRIYIWFLQAHYFFFHLFFALHPLCADHIL